MPRAVTRQPKPSVLHQTIEIPAAQTSNDESAKESRPDFWTYMHSLTPEQWKDHIVYLTRERPKTQMNGVVGGYLAKIVEPFDIEDIKMAYGGYEFSYIMKRGRDVIYGGKFSVEAEPKLDKQRESTAAAENAGGGTNGLAQQIVSMLRDELERSRESAGGDHTTERAVEMLSKASEKAMEIVQKQVPTAGAGGGGNNALLDKLMTAAIERLLTPPPAAADPAKQLETMLSIFTKIDEIRGSGGGGGRRDWKAQLVDKGIEALPAVLDTLKQTREASLQIAHDRARAAEHLSRIPTPPGRPVAPSTMTPRPPGAVPAAPADPASSGLRTVPIDRSIPLERGDSGAYAVPETAPAEVFVETIDRNSTAFTNFLKQTIVEMIQRGDHGEQIVDFLDGAKPGFSNSLVQYPPEQLTAYLSLDPILRAAVEHPNWSEVLDEARNYIRDTPESGEGEEEQELETAGARRKPN